MVRPSLANAKPLGDDPDPTETRRLLQIAEKSRIGEVKKSEFVEMIS
jgi:Ca2+-binding EF-hand superfamily protein